ncbi:UNVERIFIED_CONTAM: hypothetical protein O8I53_07370 [Campylobacter lari]
MIIDPEFRLSEENKIEILNKIFTKFIESNSKNCPKFSVKEFVFNYFIDFLGKNTVTYDESKFTKENNYGFSRESEKMIDIKLPENLFKLIQIFKKANSNLNNIDYDHLEIFTKEFDEILIILSKNNSIEYRINELNNLN